MCGKPVYIIVTPEDLRVICRQAAAAMVKPGAWARNGNLATDSHGNPADVFSNDTVARSGDGWVLNCAFFLFGDKEAGHRINQLIDSQIRLDSAGKKGFVQICLEQGPEIVAQELIRVSGAISDKLPRLFTYAQLQVKDHAHQYAR